MWGGGEWGETKGRLVWGEFPYLQSSVMENNNNNQNIEKEINMKYMSLCNSLIRTGNIIM